MGGLTLQSGIAAAKITGTSKVSGTLTAVAPAGMTASSYQWKAGGTAIPGATASTYTVADAYVGQVITCDVGAVTTGTSTAAVASVPSVPSAVTLTPGYSSLIVTVGAPAYTGGTPITGYRATDSATGDVSTSASAPFFIAGRANGTARTVLVELLNSIGYGPGASSASSTPNITAGNANIVVFAGQSQTNCNGTTGTDMPANLTGPMADIYTWDPFNNKFMPYQAGVTSALHLKAGLYPDTSLNYWGPEAEFARRWKIDYPGVPLYIVKLAYSTSSLSTITQSPGKGTWDINTRGDLYDFMVSTVSAAKSVLTTAGVTPVMRAFNWIQGENDSGATAAANAYQTNLTNLVSQSRTDFLGATAPFVIGRMKTVPANSGSAAVRTAQQYVGENVAYCRWFDMDNMQLSSDAYHFGVSGTQEMGQRNYDTAALATDVVAKYVARMTTPATSADQALMVTMLDAIIRQGAWATVSVMNLYCQDTQQAALLNVKPGVAQTSVNQGMTFTARQGFTGVSSTSKIDTGIAPATFDGLGLIRPFEMCYSFYNRTQDNATTVNDLGHNATGAFNNNATFIGVSSGGTFSPWINSSPAALSNIAAQASIIGFWSLNRFLPNGNVTLYRNGTAIATTTASFGVSPLSTLSMQLGNRTGNNVGSTRQYSVFMAGKGRTAQQETAISTAMITFLTAMGAN
jgi:hypothetical protein